MLAKTPVRASDIMSQKVKIKLKDGTVIERVPRGKSLGNFSFLIVRYKNENWVINNGDEYMRGYPDVFTLRYKLKG
jgi:hypothetical protein